MAKTRKIQVTLDEADYERLSRVARREGRKLAAVVRESIVKYMLAPEDEKARREALTDLLSLPSTPSPSDWSDWEKEYSALKTETARKPRRRVLPRR